MAERFDYILNIGADADAITKEIEQKIKEAKASVKNQVLTISNVKIDDNGVFSSFLKQIQALAKNNAIKIDIDFTDFDRYQSEIDNIQKSISLLDKLEIKNSVASELSKGFKITSEEVKALKKESDALFEKLSGRTKKAYGSAGFANFYKESKPYLDKFKSNVDVINNTLSKKNLSDLSAEELSEVYRLLIEIQKINSDLSKKNKKLDDGSMLFDLSTNGLDYGKLIPDIEKQMERVRRKLSDNLSNLQSTQSSSIFDPIIEALKQVQQTVVNVSDSGENVEIVNTENVHSTSKEIDALNEKLEKLEERKKSLSAKKDDLESSIVPDISGLGEKEKEVELGKIEKLAQLKDEYAQVEKQIANVNNTIQAYQKLNLDGEVGTSVLSVKELNENLENESALLKQVQTELKKYGTVFDNLSAEEVVQKMKELNAQFDKLKSEGKNKVGNAEFNSLKKEIGSLYKYALSQNYDLSSVGSFKSVAQAFSQSIKIDAEAINKLKSQEQWHQHIVDRIKEEIRLKEQSANIPVSTTVGDVVGTDGKQSAISSSATSFSGSIEEIKNLIQQAELLKSSFIEMQQQLNTLSGQAFVDMKVKITEVKDELVDTLEKIKDFNTSIEDKLSKKDGLDVSTLKEILDYYKQIQEVNSNIEINGLDEIIEAYKSKINLLQQVDAQQKVKTKEVAGVGDISSIHSDIDSETSKLKELENAISSVIEEIDRKTQAFHNEKAAVDMIVPAEIATLEALEGELIIIRELIEQISKVPIGISFDTNNLDENTQKVLKEIADSLNSIDTSSLSNIGNVLDGFKISKSNVDNLQKLANSILTLKSNLNNVSNQGQQFLSDIKELVAQADGLKDLATVLKASTDKIAEAKTKTKSSKDSSKKDGSEVKKTADAYNELTSSLKRYNELKEKEFKGNLKNPNELNELEELQALINKAANGQDEYSNATDKATEAQDKFNKKLKEYQNSFSQNVYKKLNRDLDVFEGKDNKTSAYYETIKKIREEIKNLNIPIDFTDKQSIDQLGEAKKHIENLIDGLNNKKFDLVSNDKISNLLNSAYKSLNLNTKAPEELRNKIKNVISELENLKKIGREINALEFDALQREFRDVQVEIQKTGKIGASFGDKIKKKFGDVAAYFATYVSIQDAIQILRSGFETIKEYDTALTEMNKVSKESIYTLKEFQQESFELANAVGTTASQIQNSTADFLRLGESFEQAKKSAQDANALFKVSEFSEISEATDALIAMSQAYKELDKSEINDILNYTGNNFSISTSELAVALQKSAATLKVAGNDIYEATALVTAGNAVLQDAESVGTGLKMISLRILGTEEAKNELASLGEDVDDFVVQTKSKLDETVRNYTAVASNDFKGISILDDNGNYKSTFEILRDISKVYQEILEADKKAGTNRGQALLEVLAGKNRSNVAASILQNPDLLNSVYEETLTKSQGSVAKELESQLASIESHLNELKNAWDKLWVNDENREIINFLLDFATGILKVVDNIGVLQTAIIGLGAGFGIKKTLKGEGRVKKFTLINMPSAA